MLYCTQESEYQPLPQNPGQIRLAAPPFHVCRLAGSALASGAMFTVHVLPTLALGSPAGVFLDGWHRRSTAIIADVARAGV